MHLGKKIKLLRNIKGISQEQLANKIRRTRALISHIEQSGKANYETLMLILNYFNISKEDFDNFEQNQIKPNKSKDYTYQIEEIESLKNQLGHCQNENKILIELIESQKEIIKFLKSKRSK
jgi:transcriptional regulator with XRE-family HTH domain